MLRIVSYAICPFVQRVTAMLEAKGLAYEIEYIDLGQKPQWFLDISPNGQVPVLITEGDVALHESDAIVEYIDEISEPLVGGLSPVDRARERAWSYQASKHYLPQCSTMQSGDKDMFRDRVQALHKAFARIEARLGNAPFYSGSGFGNVDAAWLPLLHRANIVREHSGYDMLDGYPKMQAWQKAVMKTGIPGKTVASDFEDRFMDFYLSDRTFLGRGADFEESYIPMSTHKTITSCG